MPLSEPTEPLDYATPDSFSRRTEWARPASTIAICLIAVEYFWMYATGIGAWLILGDPEPTKLQSALVFFVAIAPMIVSAALGIYSMRRGPLDTKTLSIIAIVGSIAWLVYIVRRF